MPDRNGHGKAIHYRRTHGMHSSNCIYRSIINYVFEVDEPGIFNFYERIILQILLIALAGSAGALSRYGLGSLVSNISGDKFAFGTLTVNILGCFLIGFVMHIAQATEILSEDIKMTVTVGFLGALTTFSTFSMETYKYIENSQWLHAGSNIALNVILGLIATITGLAIARLIVSVS